MTVIGMSIWGALLIAIACVVLLAVAGGLLTRNTQGRAAESVDPIGDKIQKPSQEFRRPRDEGDLL